MKRTPARFDDFSRHEVYDRASIVLELFCNSVAQHPVVARDNILSAQAQKTTDAIYRFYSMAADKLMPAGKKKIKR